MEYRSLGRTGMQVSTLCLGCMMFGGRTEPGRVAARSSTGPSMPASTSSTPPTSTAADGAKKRWGQALKRNGKRSHIVLATKVHGRMADDDPNAQGNSRRHIIEQCEASLKRLQTDYIDLYQIHRPELRHAHRRDPARPGRPDPRAARSATSAPAPSPPGR